MKFINALFLFVSFPLLLIIALISWLCVMFLSRDITAQVKQGKLSELEGKQKLVSDFNHFFLYEGWNKIYPFVRALIAGAIYYKLYHWFF